MNRNRRLQRVVELASDRETEAARALARMAGEMEQAQARIEALRRFRGEYVNRLQDGGMISAVHLHEYRTFLSSLGRAIEEQEVALAKMRQEYAALRQAWRQAHCHTQGIRKVQAKLAREENQSRERRLQREQDDRSASRRRRRTS